VTGCARGEYALSGRPGGVPAPGSPAAKRRCRSRRRIVIHPRGRAVRVRTRGVKPRSVRIRGRRVVLDLRGSRRGRIVVTIRLRGGRSERRVYRTCGLTRRRVSAAGRTLNSTSRKSPTQSPSSWSGTSRPSVDRATTPPTSLNG
jgi:hypothetical protein